MSEVDYHVLPFNVNPYLKTKTLPFDFAKPPHDPVELSKILCDALIRYKGIGIAAPQLGLPYRVFAMVGNPMIVCFNPRIVDESSIKIFLEEGCLSFPGLVVNKNRPKMIKARFDMPNGETVTVKYDGITARCFQHELDHLDGKVFFDDVSKMKLKMAYDRAKKTNKVSYTYKQLLKFMENEDGNKEAG